LDLFDKSELALMGEVRDNVEFLVNLLNPLIDSKAGKL